MKLGTSHYGQNRLNVYENGAEKNIWTQEIWIDRRMEKVSFITYIFIKHYQRDKINKGEMGKAYIMH
jgi:hypothetical protein